MADTETASFHRAAALGDVREGFVTMVKVAGRPIVLSRVDGDIAAFDGICTHAKFMLGTSRLTKACEIECPVHGALFDARTGAVTKGPAEIPLPRFNVRIEGEDVLVEIAPAQQS